MLQPAIGYRCCPNLVFGLERYFQLCQKPADGCLHGCETGGNLVLGGDKLQQVRTASCLPSRLNSGLNAEVVRPCVMHIEKGCPKSCCPEKLGYRARVSIDTMSLLYKTILRPRLEYASIA